jgi:hypothetical protein
MIRDHMRRFWHRLPRAANCWVTEKEEPMMLTTAIYEPTQPAAFRRICSWCRSDLGALDHHAQDHSYGICEACAHRYFAYLYEPDTLAALIVTSELQVGVN